MSNTFKTMMLLTLFAGFFMTIGGLIAGVNGIITAFLLATLVNFGMYYFSETIVLNMYKAKELDPDKYGFIYNIVRKLVNDDNLPMPKLWLVESDMANAFATGRNPSHASVALTSGILKILNEEELRAVLAHEISHIKNNDILVGTIAATLATSISMLANIRYRLHAGRSNDRNRNGVSDVVILFLISMLAPVIAAVIKAAISRTREYLADESGAKISHDPLALARALEKLQASVATLNNQNYRYAAISHLFIVSPFTSTTLYELFSTHPSVAKRVSRLEHIYNDMNTK